LEKQGWKNILTRGGASTKLRAATASMKSRSVRLIVAAGIVGLALAAPAREMDADKLPPASSRKDVTFEKDIKTILDHSCVKCHGAEKPKARLRLDSLAGVLKGGVDGKVVEPGNSAKSILLFNIAQLSDKDEWMPPPRNKLNIPPLSKAEIGLIRAWIDQGAK
jgi:hypothetical protein